jgi:hypothetical protein
MLEKVKLALRIKNSAYDADIQDLIDACKVDLSMGGVEIIEETDPITAQAIKLYCKGNYGYGENPQKFIEAYEKLKQSMALCGDYKAVV